MSHTKIFQSLNCPLCKRPYSNSTHDQQSPRQLGCGAALCRKCWLKDKPLEKEKRAHECEWPVFIDCFWGDVPPYFLLEILHNPAIGRRMDGYALIASLQIPKCPRCNRQYSVESEERGPYNLECGHAVCNACFDRVLNKPNGFFEKLAGSTAKCPTCGDISSYWMLKTRENQLQQFLRELPSMPIQSQVAAISQRQVVNKLQRFPESSQQRQVTVFQSPQAGSSRESGNRKCQENDCRTPETANDLHYCFAHGKVICGGCGFRNHRTCETSKLM